MLTLVRSSNSRTGTNAPQPLPVVFHKLATDLELQFRRSQLSMVAGASGCGKSVFALLLALLARVPTMYFSADTDADTMETRAKSALTGQPQRIARTSDPSWEAYFQRELQQKADHIVWNYETSLDPSEIEEEIQAFGMAWGEWPHLIVFDVLLSYQQGAGDWQSLNEFLLFARDIAGWSNAHVMVLHHTVGKYADDPNAPPKSALINKIDQLPAVIVTLGRGDEWWSIAGVKNRNGKSDALAQRPIRYRVDFERVGVTQ